MQAEASHCLGVGSGAAEKTSIRVRGLNGLEVSERHWIGANIVKQVNGE